MTYKMISSEQEVNNFLKELKSILTDPSFDISRDLDILQKKSHESLTDPFTTMNTLLELDFDSQDVLNQLLSLDITEYIETAIDYKDSSLPPFFVFNKSIRNKDVYIKVKIRNIRKLKVFCVSFHFARFPFREDSPYK